MAKRLSKASKKLSRTELKERYLSWFALSRYERCKHFGAIDWFQQIACRIDLQRMNSLWGMEAAEQSSAGLDKASHYANLLRETQAAGIIPRRILAELEAGSRDLSPERFATLALLDTRGCAVRSMTLSDLLRVAHACDEDMLYEAEQQLQDDRWKMYPERSTNTFLSRTIKSSLPPANTANNLAYLVIDLNQPASVIATQLQELMPQQLSECFYTPASPEKAKNPKYVTWRDAQVLAYIDLLFWKKRITDKSIRSKITNEFIAECLERAPDSVRHTTRARVHELMDPHGTTFTALREQAISEARELEYHHT